MGNWQSALLGSQTFPPPNQRPGLSWEINLWVDTTRARRVLTGVDVRTGPEETLPMLQVWPERLRLQPHTNTPVVSPLLCTRSWGVSYRFLNGVVLLWDVKGRKQDEC